MNGSTLQESALDYNALDPVRPSTVVGQTISLLVCQGDNGRAIKSQLERPRLSDHWFDHCFVHWFDLDQSLFDLDQSYQTGRTLVENCSQSPPAPGIEFVRDKHAMTLQMNTSLTVSEGFKLSQTWVFASLLSGLGAPLWRDPMLEVKGTGSFINPLFSSWVFDSRGKNFCWGCLFTIGVLLVKSGLGRSWSAGLGLWKKIQSSEWVVFDDKG